MKKLATWVLGAAIGALGFDATAQAMPILNPGNGNYYEFINTGTHPIGSLLWEKARDDAAGMSFMGRTGHLATLTSEAESNWFEAQFGGLAGWLGGKVTNPGTGEGTRIWGWVVGPDQFDFWQETGLNGAGVALNGAYTDWQGGEPNFQQNGADSLRYVGNGWDDTINRPGYFVEYSATEDVPEPATLTIIGLGLAGLGLARRRRKEA